MSVNLKENKMMERYDILIPFKLGNLKDTMDVGHWDHKKDTITLTKELKVQDIRAILNKVENEACKLDNELDEEPMSNCCSAPFWYPGWPDNDLCSKCGEHADIWKEEEEKRFELNPDE